MSCHIQQCNVPCTYQCDCITYNNVIPHTTMQCTTHTSDCITDNNVTDHNVISHTTMQCITHTHTPVSLYHNNVIPHTMQCTVHTSVIVPRQQCSVPCTTVASALSRAVPSHLAEDISVFIILLLPFLEELISCLISFCSM